jgi:hypothetical protein
MRGARRIKAYSFGGPGRLLKLEFFEEGLDGGPMILLYGGGPEEVAQLRNAIQVLSRGVGSQFALNDLPFLQSVDRCQLRTTCAEADLGVVVKGSADFEWILGPASWLKVDEQLEPFCAQRSGVSFQYLNPASGPEIIYSTVRAW